MKTLFAFIFLLSGLTAFSQTYTIETVPNDKLVTGSYVSNPDGLLTAESVATINSILRELEDSTTAEVAVVMLRSIGDIDEITFSQELFERWGIGKSTNNNGLLILYVEDQHVIRFHTGDGIEGVLPDVICKRIQMSEMVPDFKEGNVDQGMIDGVREVAGVLRDPEVAASYQEADKESNVELADFSPYIMGAWGLVAIIVFVVKLKRKSFGVSTADAVKPHARLGPVMWSLWYMIVPLLIIAATSFLNNIVGLAGGMYAWTGAGLLLRRKSIDDAASQWEPRKDYHAIYNFFQQEQGLFSAMRFVFPFPFAFMYGGFKRKMQYYRDHPRDCQQCGKPLVKLDEKADDALLAKNQLLEEGLKSVDYDVWKCTACNAAEKLSYINDASKYKPCPKCKTRAYYKESDRVITAATTSSSGTGEEIHTCKYCKERTVRRYTIARIQTSSSSSSGSGSSGGSWGGGSSSGGGASSRW